MNLLTLALADLREQKLANALHLLLLMLGVAMVTALLLIGNQIGGRFERDAHGVDLVIGAKGSPLQLILSTVYHLDVPTGNIPLAEASRWGHHPMIASAIPISLGDNARGFRIVGTTPELIRNYQASVVAGREWSGPMEAVIGADVAKAGLELNATFIGVHGLSAAGHAHADHPYKVVGVLAPTNTVLDRLILTSLDSVWEVHSQHHHHEPATAGAEPDADGDDDDDHEAAAADGYQPSKEITALLVRYRSPLAAAALPRMINTNSNLQAAVPAFETARLLQLLGLGFDTLRALAIVLIAAATLSVFVALYNAMEARQYDVAVLRSLGASRREVVTLLWLEALMLSAAGTILGILLAHAAVELLGHVAGTAKGVRMTGWDWLPGEMLILLLPLAVGTVAAALPAWRAYRTDVAHTLSRG
ncbi:MAG TPA: FtsX-like permease family protein [Nevskiaceae bacterium]|nr:FtsX-like permease family protein [Nevskiaceae bacterium]